MYFGAQMVVVDIISINRLRNARTAVSGHLYYDPEGGARAGA